MRQPTGTTLRLLVGLVGVLVALVLPFAPVSAEQATVTWPAPGRPVVPSMALFVPYRPAELTVTVPCSVLRAAAGQDRAVTVLATGPPGGGLALRTEAGTARLMLGSRMVRSIPVAGTATDCRTRLHAGPGATVITTGNSRLDLAGEPVPEVFAFRTELDPTQAAGMTVTARTASPFATSPTALKILLITIQLLTAFVALGLLANAPACRAFLLGVSRFSARPALIKIAWVDAGVVAVLAGWAIIGPLTDDDGFATTIARNAALTGNVGNYYRWWNASETPFALTEQLLAQLTQISLAPLWLRLPSTVLGIATWFVVSRGVLGAALPAPSTGTVRVRLLAAVCLLAAWLPFNLGVRPEPYVAFGVTTVLALLYRARGLASLGWAALVAGLTIPVSPGGLLVAAPIAIFAPRIVGIVGGSARGSARGRVEVLARVLLLCCIGAVGLTVIFADQTWEGLVTATRWHNFFGPSLPWYQEPDRYRFLLTDDQDGTATKRLPVLVTLALLPVVAVLVGRRRAEPDDIDRAAGRLAGVVTTAMALLWFTPSKWTHHFGALAGLLGSFLVVAVVLLLRRSRAPVADRVTTVVGVAGAVLVAGAAGLAFAGPNAWWQPAVYDVPWANSPVRPLDAVLLWIGAAALTVLVTRRLLTAPAMLTVAAAAASVVVLVGSFLAAPVRRPAGSLARANLHQLAGGHSCGLADSIQVLTDGAVLVPADTSEYLAGRTAYLAGFTSLGGFDPAVPPPDTPGTGTSAQLWGSLAGGPRSTGTLISPWFTLPALRPASGVALSVSGRTDRGNRLALEFGRAMGTRVVPVGERTPFDLVKRSQEHLDGPPEYRPWRSIGLDAAQVPSGANRVRIRAVDATTDPDGWVAVTGPRLRSVVGLTQFLAGHGPVLVSWPLAFLFPCVHNTVGVADGLASTPRVVIEAPRRFGGLSAVTTDPTQGGVFAGLRTFGELHEITTRLAGHPDIDWGTLQRNTTRDTYLVHRR